MNINDNSEMNFNCSNCNADVSQEDKYCPECGLKLETVEFVDKSVIVSTGDIRGNYEIIGTVHLYHNSLLNEQMFNEKKLAFDQVIDKIIEHLKIKTYDAGGNGIIYLRVDFEQMPLGGTQYFVYGTMIKIIK